MKMLKIPSISCLLVALTMLLASPVNAGSLTLPCSSRLECAQQEEIEPKKVAPIVMDSMPVIVVQWFPVLELMLPNLILMDMFMPGIDGPSAFQKLQENEALAQIPVVFLTANSSAQDAERLEKMGAAGVVTKPFQPSELSSQVRQFLLNGTS